jgi:hypothetical protein
MKVADRNTLAGFIAHLPVVAKLRQEWQTTGCPGCNCKDDGAEQDDA